MSNHLAFATVTATLHSLLEAAVKDRVNGAHATVERLDSAALKDAVGVNIFLYQVTPNPAWRNGDLPTRRPDGTTVQRPQAAFDLHYLLSFHGKEKDYEPQRLLGAVVRILHSQPVLSRQMIRDVSTGDLSESNLADQVELVRFSPHGFSLEELSKLWSVFFQVPYKLSLAYQASVVLVEAEVSTQAALPVRARNLYVVPFHQPEVDEVEAAAGRGQPILPGDIIVLRGRNLKGEVTRVRLGEAEVQPAADKVRDDEIRVALPAGLRAGIVGAQVIHPRLMGTPAKPHAGVESNVAPFVLHPRIKKRPDTTPDVSISAPTSGVRTVTVGIEPTVGKSQRVVLLLNEPVENAPKAFSAVNERRDADLDAIEFKLAGLEADKEFLVRVQVDGAESPLEVVGGAYAAPKVKVPNP